MSAAIVDCCCGISTDARGRNTEALELRVDIGRVNRSWCIGVVSQSYVGMGGGWYEGSGW